MRIYRIIQLVAVLLLGVMLWGGWYVSNRGFTRKWRNELVKEFRKRGVEVSFSRLTLDPLRGLVARDVRLIDNKDPDYVLATISSIVLDINYANLAQGESFLNGIDLRDAHLSLPLARQQRLELTNLRAKIVMSPQQMHLRDAEANCYGIRLKAHGDLINPQAMEQGKGGRLKIGWLPAVVEVLGKIIPHEERPELVVRFSGDLADAGSLYAEATMSSHGFSYEQFHVRELFGKAVYREGIFDLHALSVGDGRGRLELGGYHQLKTGDTAFHLRSSLDLQPLADLFPQLQGLRFESLPLVDLSGSLKAMDLQVLGEVSVNRFSIGAVPYTGFRTGFSWKAGDWYLSGLQLAQGTGKLEADVLQRAGRWRAKVESSLGIQALAPLAPEGTRGWFERCSSKENARLTLSTEGEGRQPLQGTGAFAIGNAMVRGVSVKSLSTELRFEPGSLVCDNFKLVRNEGVATGQLRYLLGSNEVRLERIESNLWPAEVAAAIDPAIARALAPYRFQVPPRLLLSGKIPVASPGKSELGAHITAPKVAFLQTKLPATSASGRVLFNQGTLKISDLRADLFGGQLQLQTEVGISGGKKGYSAQLRVEGVDFVALAKLYSNYTGSGGKLNGYFDFSGPGKEARLLKGNGKLEVVDANIFALPLFGPLSGIFESVLPGAGVRKAQKGTASFQVAEGIVSTGDLSVQGLGFAILGEGQLNLLEDKIDFNLRLNARGAPVLFPVSKLLEFKGDGSLSQPRWRPKRLPGG